MLLPLQCRDARAGLVSISVRIPAPPPIPPTRRSGSAGRADRTPKIELSGAGSGIIAEPRRLASLIGDRPRRAGPRLLSAALFAGPGFRERPIPEARPALDAAVGADTAEDPGNHAHDPGHMRRPVDFSATTTGTNVTFCHSCRFPLMGEPSSKPRIGKNRFGDGPHPPRHDRRPAPIVVATGPRDRPVRLQGSASTTARKTRQSHTRSRRSSEVAASSSRRPRPNWIRRRLRPCRSRPPIR